MANISSVGIGSGVLTSDLIDKLVAAEREPTELRLDSKEESITTELSVFGQIQSAVTDFRLASRPLADPALFQSLDISSSNTAVSGAVASSAQAGSYTLEVSELAKSQSLSSAVFADTDTTTLGTGDLAITIGSTTTNITIDGSNNTLGGIAAAINSESSLGATASVINVGSGYRLVITADDTGLENAIDIVVTDTGDGDNDDLLGLSQLSYTTGALNLNQNQAATDAAFELNGLAITRSTNTFDDVIQGVTLTLSGTNENNPAVLEISRDNDAVVEQVQNFIDKFNALEQIISDNTGFNPDNPAASGLLLGDSSTRSIINQIQSVIGQSIPGLGSASVRSMADLGITTNKDTGQLQFDSSKLVSALNSDAESVAGVFADQGRTSDSQVEFVRAGLGTKAGTYDINISQIATKGNYLGTVALPASTDIDADNEDFNITVDGIASNAIVLDFGSYTPAELATQLQEKINADLNLIAAGKSVTVTLDGSDQLVISSGSFGSDSNIEFTAVDTNTATEFGFDVGAGTAGVDVEGTINGVAATGSGQYLTAADDDDAESIRLLISGGALGDRGTVSYIEGVGEQMVDLINGFLGANGVITAKNERLNAQLQVISEERVSLEQRITSLNERLVRQFTAADIIIARLNSTQDFISQQLDAIVASNKKE